MYHFRTRRPSAIYVPIQPALSRGMPHHTSQGKARQRGKNSISIPLHSFIYFYSSPGTLLYTAVESANQNNQINHNYIFECSYHIDRLFTITFVHVIGNYYLFHFT